MKKIIVSFLLVFSVIFSFGQSVSVSILISKGERKTNFHQGSRILSFKEVLSSLKSNY